MHKQIFGIWAIIVILLIGSVAAEDRLPDKNENESKSKSKRHLSLSDRDLFLVKVDPKIGLVDSLAGSFQIVSNPYNKIILGGNLLVGLDDFDLSPGKIYVFDGDHLTDPLSIGRLTVFLGRIPIAFEMKKHLWAGQVMTTEYVCRKSALVENLRLVREICLDHRNRCFVFFKLSGLPKNLRSGLKPGDFRIRLEPPANQPQWKVWIRLPDSTLKRPGQTTGVVECPWTDTAKASMDLLIVARWDSIVPNSSTAVSADEIEMENQMTRSRPIGPILTAQKRWIARTFPAWDCPEPWLNKLWAGQVYAFSARLAGDEAKNEIYLRGMTDDTLQDLFDARWLRNSDIALATLRRAAAVKPPSPFLAPAASAVFRCSPDPVLQKIIFNRTLAAVRSIGEPKSKNEKLLLFANTLVLSDWADSAGARKLFHSRAESLLHQVNPGFHGRPALSEISSILWPEYNLGDETTFLHWCRSFYRNDDFQSLIIIESPRDPRNFRDTFPRGVFDCVVTRILGLQDDGRDYISLFPAKWIADWPYFAIDNLPFRGHNLTVVWQSPRHARRYANMEYGFVLFIDGLMVRRLERLEPMEVEIK